VAASVEVFAQDGTEQEILARIRHERAAGAPLRRIADDLNGDGILARRGSAWQFQYIASLLRADAQSGKLTVAA